MEEVEEAGKVEEAWEFLPGLHLPVPLPQVLAAAAEAAEGLTAVYVQQAAGRYKCSSSSSSSVHPAALAGMAAEGVLPLLLIVAPLV